jgi:hypothetical protein
MNALIVIINEPGKASITNCVVQTLVDDVGEGMATQNFFTKFHFY